MMGFDTDEPDGEDDKCNDCSWDAEAVWYEFYLDRQAESAEILIEGNKGND